MHPLRNYIRIAVAALAATAAAMTLPACPDDSRQDLSASPAILIVADEASGPVWRKSAQALEAHFTVVIVSHTNPTDREALQDRVARLLDCQSLDCIAVVIATSRSESLERALSSRRNQLPLIELPSAPEEFEQAATLFVQFMKTQSAIEAGSLSIIRI